MKLDKISLSNQKASLTAYLLDQSPEFNNIESRPAVLIFPGGGYYTTSDREAEPVAMAYLAEGFNVFILRYSVGKDSSFEVVLNDAEEAISLIRENAENWNINENKVTVIGFSAGGHLAAALGTMGTNKPNTLILGYPVILSNIELAFPLPSLDKEVGISTPPTFLFSTFEDEVVPIQHTLSFIEALNYNKIPFESHIFQKGKHGLSLSKPLSSSGLKSFVDNDFAQWFRLSVSWLHKVLGDFPSEKESLIPQASDLKEYSIDVQIGSLLENKTCKDIIFEYIPVFKDETLIDGVKGYSIRIINQHLPESLPETILLEMNNRLRGIPYSKI